MLYFAYGSNMATGRLVARIPAARRIGSACLSGYTLKFNVRSTKDGSGKCNVCLSSDPGEQVTGVLYEIPDTEKTTLDRYEGTGVEYRDAWLQVRSGTGEVVKALIYLGLSLDETALPYPWYVEHVIRGAMENGHPQSFIERLRAISTINDPDPERAQRELHIYTTVA